MELRRLDQSSLREAFTCGDADLDEFYRVDSIVSSDLLLSVTYVVMEDEKVLAFFSVSNDAISKEVTSRSVFKKLIQVFPRGKQYSSMPAVKIGRLGVASDHQSKGLGKVVLDFLKGWFITGNKTGCRFIVVDAYDQPRIIKFYENSGFKFLPSKNQRDGTRIMYFDLAQFRE